MNFNFYREDESRNIGRVNSTFWVVTTFRCLHPLLARTQWLYWAARQRIRCHCCDNIGTITWTKINEFLENFQTASDPPFFEKLCCAFLQQAFWSGPNPPLFPKIQCIFPSKLPKGSWLPKIKQILPKKVAPNHTDKRWVENPHLKCHRSLTHDLLYWVEINETFWSKC